MCQPLSPEQEAMFDKTVDQFVEQGRPFTGFDLTLATRKRENIRLRHRDVREGIHEMTKLRDLVDFDDWNVSLESIGDKDGQTIQARIYYPDGYDLSQYEPVGMNPASQPISQPVSQPVSVSTSPATPTLGTPLGSDDDDEDDDLQAADDVGSQNADGTFGTNFKGGLFVRTAFLREAGLSAGDDCHMIIAQGSITLSKTTVGHHSYISMGQKKVERNGDIRLAKRTLLEAGMNGSTFKIENTDNGILIEEA